MYEITPHVSSIKRQTLITSLFLWARLQAWLGWLRVSHKAAAKVLAGSTVVARLHWDRICFKVTRGTLGLHQNHIGCGQASVLAHF